ncbi:hypothetical protein Fot_45372 [Forsythia ovata]|uniref:Uncharacterized protein n=1 Tax=Forsythia ovata TaxID=205694 RepID=A0ABD1R6C3_9LAMI
MGQKIWLSKMAMVCILLLILWEMALPSMACPSDGTECSNCILNRMKSGCPGCVPIMQCMARCLWSGTTRSKCIKKCDCAGGYPRLVDCKKCLSQCKCSCLS